MEFILVEQTGADVPTPSTSRDEMSIIDETVKPSIAVEEIMIMTDDSDMDEAENRTAVNLLFSKVSLIIFKVKNNIFNLLSYDVTGAHDCRLGVR